MARIDISRFSESKSKNQRPHNLISGEYTIIYLENQKLLQIDTFGSDDRQIKGKMSQSIQLDKAVLEKLVNIYFEKFK